MNFFKKALVATAVVASFGASAAIITPSTTILEISKEGIAAEVATPDTGFDFDVKVEAATPAASTITVTFGEDVDLTTPAAAITGTVTQAAGSSTDGDVAITFGTGSFTFDNIAIDTTTDGAHVLTFDVSLGQPIANGGAFNVAFATGAVEAASIASYVANDGASDVDTGNGAISIEVSQYGFSVDTTLDKLINREDDEVFTDGTTEDDLVVTISDNQGLSRAVTTAPTYSVTATGVFTDIIAADLAADAGTPTMSTADKVIDIALVPADITIDGTDTDVTLTIDPALDATDVKIPATGDVTVGFEVTSADFSSGSLVVATSEDGGEWLVDATIINVPYLPVGFEGTNSTVILSNEGSTATDVIVTAIDQNGEEYGPVNLNTTDAFADDLPALTVSKVSDALLMDLLGAEAGSKLSVTFNIDANEGVVNGYAYTQKAGTGRSEVSTSQQRGN